LITAVITHTCHKAHYPAQTSSYHEIPHSYHHTNKEIKNWHLPTNISEDCFTLMVLNSFFKVDPIIMMYLPSID
jgi:hypothetical protein